MAHLMADRYVIAAAHDYHTTRRSDEDTDVRIDPCRLAWAQVSDRDVGVSLLVGQVGNLQQVGNPLRVFPPPRAPVANRRAGFQPAPSGSNSAIKYLVLLAIPSTARQASPRRTRTPSEPRSRSWLFLAIVSRTRVAFTWRHAAPPIRSLPRPRSTRWASSPTAPIPFLPLQVPLVSGTSSSQKPWVCPTPFPSCPAGQTMPWVLR